MMKGIAEANITYLLRQGGGLTIHT